MVHLFGFIVYGPDWLLKWEWSDWVGLGVILLIVAFIATAIFALRHGAAPLKVLDKTADLVRAALRTKPK